MTPSRGAQTPTNKEIELFKQYDKNKTGCIKVDELKDLMADLGLLNGRSSADISASVVATFAAADTDRDGCLNLPEFTAYYRKASAPRLVDLLATNHRDSLDALRLAFKNWASFGAGSSRSKQSAAADTNNQTASKFILGSAHWMKLCKDTGIVAPGSLTSTDADLIFAKVKDRGQQRLTFLQFVDALGMVAARRGQDVVDLVQQIVDSAGPVLNGTTIAVPNFYGEKRAEVGARRKSSNSGNIIDINASTSSTPVTGSHLKEEGSQATPTERRSSGSGIFSSVPRKLSGEEKISGAVHTPQSAGSTIPAFHSGASHPGASPELASLSDAEEVLRVFSEFAGFGTGSISSSSASPLKMEMDSKQFAKLAKESHLSKSPADAVAVDLCFTKAKARGTRRIGFAEFLVALAMLAQEKGQDETEVLSIVASCPGPRRNSTTPDFCRLHDDKTTFTGVYKRGGPVTVDASAPNLAKLLSRDPARLSM